MRHWHIFTCRVAFLSLLQRRSPIDSDRKGLKSISVILFFFFFKTKNMIARNTKRTFSCYCSFLFFLFLLTGGNRSNALKTKPSKPSWFAIYEEWFFETTFKKKKRGKKMYTYYSGLIRPQLHILPNRFVQ